jgi:hypothetical protein
MKKCNDKNCAIPWKDENCFHKDKYQKDGLRIYCKDCVHRYDVVRNKKVRQIRTAQHREWVNKNKIYSQEYNKQYRHRQEHKGYFSEYRYEYERERLDSDIQFKMTKYLRNRMRGALRRNQKSGSAVHDLGCSIEDLKLWLENQFQPGMTWENYGKEWQIDHIIPLSSVDLSDRKQFLKVCNWFNLQPLWAHENISKGDKI